MNCFENERNSFGVFNKISKARKKLETPFSFESGFHTVKYAPLGGSFCIPLPAFLAAKKAIINLKNEDDECFKLAITRALSQVEKHSERIDKKLRET